VVGDEDAYAAIGEMAHQGLDVADRNRIDAGEGLVEQHVIRPRGERTGDLDAAALAAGERDGRRLAQARDVELLEQRIEVVLAPLGVGFDHFEHRADVLFDAQAPKNRGFLRQIADAEAGALVHRQTGYVGTIELDAALVGFDEAGDHVENRGFAGAIGTEQADRLTLAYVQADALDHLAADKAFLDAMHGKQTLAVARYRAVAGGAATRSGGRARSVHNRRLALRSRRRRRRLLHRRRHGWWRGRGRSNPHLLRRRGQARDVEINVADPAANAGEIDRLMVSDPAAAGRRATTAKICENVLHPKSSPIESRIMSVLTMQCSRRRSVRLART